MIEALRALAARRDLTEAEAQEAMSVILRGDATRAQIAGFAMGLTVKGVTAGELLGMTTAVRAAAVPFPVPGDVLDTCGTGGSGHDVVNLSTAAAVVAAACGARVAKHGNRAASSACGSADVLERLGVRIDLPPAEAARCLARTGITFLFAPSFHPAFRYAAAPRSQLGVRTPFNLLGPLCNPAGARHQLLGVAEPGMPPLLTEVLRRLGGTRSMVFRAEDGLDELSTCAPTRIIEVLDGRRREYTLRPERLGLAPARLEELRGGDAAHNARVLRAVLTGRPGPHRDAVLLNAAGALRVAGLADGWEGGLRLAAAAVDEGRARATLETWAETSRSLAPPAGTTALAGAAARPGPSRT